LFPVVPRRVNPMKSVIALSIATAIACVGAGTAQAQIANTQFYGTLGYAQDQDEDLGVLQGRLGARFGRFVGVEGEVGAGVKSYNSDFGYKRSIEYQVASYAVAYAPLSPNIDLLARVGYGATRFKSSFSSIVPPLSGKFTENSWNLGVGGQYLFDGKNGVRLDYVHQDFESSPNGNVWSIAYTRRF
jgi:outer membrane immunogenic protein